MKKAKRIEYREEDYLEKLISEEKMVKIYLSNGIGLEGKILGADEFSLLLSKVHGDTEQIIYKDAIASINLNVKD